MSLLRAAAISTVVAILMSSFLVRPAARAAQLDVSPRSSLEVPPPPGRKGPNAQQWQRLDLPYTFKAGVIWVKIQTGTRIGDLLRKHNLPGLARQLWEPPHNAVARRIGLDRWYEVTVPVGLEKDAVRRLSPVHASDMIADFVYAHISWDFPGWATLTPNDTRFGDQAFYLDAIGIRRAWDKQTADPNVVTVAVIDSGLRGSHEDSATWKQKIGYDYVNSQDIFPGADTEWYFGRACYNGDGHGTQVATIAVGDTNNGKGIAGAGFNAGLMPFRTLGTTDGVNCVWVVPQDRRGWAVRTAADRGAKVINMSYTFGGGDLLFEEESMLYAWDLGAIPVSTAGNDGIGVKYYPCGYDWVICVGAANWNGTAWVRWSGSPNPSNYGAAWVDFSAPGVCIWGATANTTMTYKCGTGTSYAAPLVSGVFALLHANGQFTPKSKLDKLAATARADGWTAYGFIDAGEALWRP